MRIAEALSSAVHRTECITLFLKPHMWFFSMVELILALFGLFFNCLVAVSIYYATPISVIQRRSLAAISLNYAFISGLHMAKCAVAFISIHYPCISVITTLNCKLQEFPLVFLYIHGALLPLILAIQAFFKHKENREKVTWANAVTIHQTSVIILCLVLSLLFTAFDEDQNDHHLLQCSIVMAIQKKDMAFWLITTLIIGHAVALILVQLAAVNAAGPTVTFKTFFNENLRDYIVFESFMWELALLFTGIFAVYEFIALQICEKCLAIALELTFIVMPLCICCANPLLAIWIILPVRNAATRLCPLVKGVLPEYELPTPSLASPETTNRLPTVICTKIDTKEPL